MNRFLIVQTLTLNIGAIGLFWSVALFIFASDSPETNRFISDAEKEYILKATEKEALSRHTGLTVIKLYLLNIITLEN